IAQDVDQLQTHAVALPHSEHLVFTSRGNLAQMAKAKPGPKFSRAAGHEIDVFVKLSRRFQGNNSLWISDTLEVEDLASVNLLQHSPDFFAIQDFALLEPIQTWLQRLYQRV